MHIDPLLEASDALKKRVQSEFKRYLYTAINWENRLIGIKGARGTGKTTLLFQRLSGLNKHFSEAAYFSLDNLFFTSHHLSDVIAEFYKKGGKWLFLDEVHKYPGWTLEVRKLYETYPDLQIVFAGSSIIDINRQGHGLVPDVDMYDLHGLSYREYLAWLGILDMKPFSLEEILQRDQCWKTAFPPDFRPLQYFDNYLAQGYYPFFINHPDNPPDYLQQLIRLTVEYDMAELTDFDIRNAKKMLQLYYILAVNAPFKPNVSKLAEESTVHRNTINNYFQILEQGCLARLLYPSGKNTAVLQKPEKIYLDNTNLSYGLASQSPQKGNLRETFFVNQLSVAHKVCYPGKGDFMVDEKYVFEIGRKKKSPVLIRGTLNSFHVLDDVAYPEGIETPLWLFGFLY